MPPGKMYSCIGPSFAGWRGPSREPMVMDSDAHLPSGARGRRAWRSRQPEGSARPLDHLDVDDGVVLALDLAVVAQAHVHAVGYASGGPPQESSSWSGQGDRGDLGSASRRADGERGPIRRRSRAGCRSVRRRGRDPVDPRSRASSSWVAGPYGLVSRRTTPRSRSSSDRGSRRTGRRSGRSGGDAAARAVRGGDAVGDVLSARASAPGARGPGSRAARQGA